MRSIWALMYKEALLELRNKAAIAGLVLYVLGVVFVTGLALRGKIDAVTWNTLYWIILVFASLQTVAKGFMSETDAQQRYLYTLAGPLHILIGKTLYNILLLLGVALIAFIVYTLLLGYPGQESMGYYVVVVILGSVALSSVLTLVSALAGRAGGNYTLMAILSLPLLVPVLLTLIRLGAAALAGVWIPKDIVLVLSMAMLSQWVGLFLFPYIWRS